MIGRSSPPDAFFPPRRRHPCQVGKYKSLGWVGFEIWNVERFPRRLLRRLITGLLRSGVLFDDVRIATVEASPLEDGGDDDNGDDSGDDSGDADGDDDKNDEL